MNWLDNCILFNNIETRALAEINDKFITKKTYAKKNTIAHEGDICQTIGLVQAGKIELQTIYPSGKVLTHLRLKQSDVFGEALLFNAHNKYPIFIKALSDCQIGYIDKRDLLIIFNQYPQILNNFLMLMSDKLLILNKKIRNLSLDSLDKRVANFLLQSYKKHASKMFNVGISRKAMAEMMGVQRPSLSRTLAKMREDGIIDFAGDSFKILDFNKLENILLN